jgi:murein L,D-transpeptidase YafK
MVGKSDVAHRCAAAALAAILASGGVVAQPAKDAAPIPVATVALMTARDTAPSAPILMRIYKKEAELEVWKKARSGRFVLLKTFPICRWSGQLGPKTKTGDRQTPEGFYAVGPAQMNPNSAYYLSFDTGFPNAYDRARGATGSALMVHGTCSSRGCFAMTDAAMGEIYAIAREAFAGGQKAFQLQAFPFRMTAENMARHRTDPHIAFWRQLKEGSDRFDATGEEPVVTVVAGRYAFKPAGDPDREAKAAARRAEQEARIARLIEDGAGAVRTTYVDGGQHPSFAALAQKGVSLGDVSRPEALALAGREVVVIAARPKPRPTQVAQAAPPRAAPKVWPAAPDLPAIEVGVRPLADEPSVFAYSRLNPDPPAKDPVIPGSIEIVPARLAAMKPLTFAFTPI